MTPRRIVGTLFRLLPLPLKSILLQALHPRWRWIAKATHNTVVSGPFQGLKYVSWSVGSSLFPKLLGTYEKELWPVIEEIASRQYARIIDIGAAEGYYAVGLATRIPEALIVCFEAQANYHSLLRNLAQLNGVLERIEVGGIGTPELLRKALAVPMHTLIVCDIEGAEDELLDPQRVPALTGADILVELHDVVISGVSARIRNRFEGTHIITTIVSSPRTQADWPLTMNVAWEQQSEYMNEHRPCVMEWFWMKAKVASSQASE